MHVLYRPARLGVSMFWANTGIALSGGGFCLVKSTKLLFHKSSCVAIAIHPQSQILVHPKWIYYLGVATEGATQAACSACCSRLTQFVSFSSCCCFSSMACSVIFDSMFPFLLCCLFFAGHFDNTIVPYRRPPKVHFKNTMVPYQLPLRITLRYVAVRLLRNTRVFSDFSQCGYCYSTNTNVLTIWRMNACIHTYIHTYRSLMK